MKYSTIRIERKDGKYNYYTVTDKKRYLLSEWVNECHKFREGFGIVEKDGKFNYVKPDGTYLLSKWLDRCFNFYNGFAVARLKFRANYVKPDGTFLLKDWVDDCYDFYDGFGVVRKGGVLYKIDKDGNTIKI